jgi:hypothetical protein
MYISLVAQNDKHIFLFHKLTCEEKKSSGWIYNAGTPVRLDWIWTGLAESSDTPRLELAG